MKNRLTSIFLIIIVTASAALIGCGSLSPCQLSLEYPLYDNVTEVDYYIDTKPYPPITDDDYYSTIVVDDYISGLSGLSDLNDSYDDYITSFTPIFTAEPLPDHIIDFITGVTFTDAAPFPHSFLSYLTITHLDFDGNDTIGHMIVAEEIADEVLEIFREIYEGGFPIYSIRLIDYFYADDYLSLAANNSSAFNFRYIANTNVISRHGFGMAIDINPVQNPYVRGDVVLPAAGREYLDRNDVRLGMIVRDDVVYQAFISRGWTWGGNWTLPRDYHHFERR